jgi:hypothetical protein
MLAPLGRRRRACSLQRLRQATLSQLEELLAPALPASLFSKNRSKAHSRDRIFTLYRTTWGWIWQVLQAHTSCREVVRQVQALFALKKAGAVDSGTSAYCQARGNLPLAFLEKLFAASIKSAERSAPALKGMLLQNRPIKVVDGSGARLADTPGNRAAYPPSKNMAQKTGFPFLRIVVLFSLSSGALLAHACGSLNCGELRLFYSLLSALRPGEILLADRAYGIYVFAALLRGIGVDLIATVPARSRRVDFRRTKKRLAHHDALFTWSKPPKASAFVSSDQWLSLPAEITVRLLRVPLVRPGFRTQQLTLITTLLDPILYPSEQIVAVHCRRWRLEMCLDDVKTTLRMENLRCQTPEMVKKELLVFLTAHNLLRWLIAQAANHGEVDMDTLSFKGAMDTFRQWSQALAQSPSRHRHRAALWEKLLEAIIADPLPFRPNRHEPRAVKKRSKYPPLSQPRRQYIERWTRNKRRRMSLVRKCASSI